MIIVISKSDNKESEPDLTNDLLDWQRDVDFDDFGLSAAELRERRKSKLDERVWIFRWRHGRRRQLDAANECVESFRKKKIGQTKQNNRFGSGLSSSRHDVSNEPTPNSLMNKKTQMFKEERTNETAST